MPSQRVLIVGAGVAGSVAAFWLAKYDFEVVVIERSKAEQKAGQGIEIEEPALQVVKAMGILDELNEKKTGELGFECHDEKFRVHGRLETGAFSPTGNLELMRGDLTEVLYKAADGSANVKYHFETTIQSLRQIQDTIIVELQRRNDKSSWTEEFDFVIGADGVKSHTRRLTMGPPEVIKCFKPVGAYVAYFSIPKEDRDWPYSRMCAFPGRRIIWIRPLGKDDKIVSVYLIHLGGDLPDLHRAIATGDRPKQREHLAKLYSGLGWEAPRVVEHIMTAENFYADELEQVKLQKWSQGRVALVGDAACAPTNFTGSGNQLAIIGGWVLAQELSRHRSPAAFETYEKRLRAYVEQCQNIPLWGYAPYIFIPQTTWGIKCLQLFFVLISWVVRFLLWSNLSKLFPEGHEINFNLEMEGVEAKTAR
ncbi:uncharacterized protein PV06_01840 [Exophiala oligosperma]|uniref:FAD-binding domain-containing protein n=1 Tax=Exophiala oligosperma TaxID=215243 RepID=A0A0D2DSV8_9EURO|nr:uncharacterized protein PV06_01840 [Exophiala oligosperma]KIW46153.1 hypothetical protein PV06_01840 [Exophiala oligosperma]